MQRLLVVGAAAVVAEAVVVAGWLAFSVNGPFEYPSPLEAVQQTCPVADTFDRPIDTLAQMRGEVRDARSGRYIIGWRSKADGTQEQWALVQQTGSGNYFVQSCESPPNHG